MDLTQELKTLKELLPYTETQHYFRLKTRFNRLTQAKSSANLDPDKREAALLSLKKRVIASAEKVAQRKATIPPIRYDDALPIAEKRAEIKKLISNHQVVIVCGETGSGKTTQLAKMCLELGLGTRGVIGHTQPRRIAAYSVANRISEELGVSLGSYVGYKMRFNDKTADNTVIKLMTDGILLNEITHDRYLNQYEVLIIDEAHERSLNIDFLLGIIKKILPKRPDLKLIITSATIDPQKFAHYFVDKQAKKKAPIIEVSGRTYPVEIRYRPLVALLEENLSLEDTSQTEEEKDLNDGIIEAVYELSTEKKGDILIFLSGEREIREGVEALEREFQNEFEILPLFSRLSQREQNRIFHRGPRTRIILSTNVAETSLTVPGIKYVIDAGLARVSRYSPRSRLQSLLIEPISQASANQRAGRCGRVSEGVCIRLYSEEDYNGRAQFLDPEILRTSLAAVILQMGYLRLGSPERFPFLDAPETRQIREGLRTLRELRAINEKEQLTSLGRQLALLPIDPRFGAMLLNGLTQGVGHELLVLVAGMSIQDPRERPLEFQQQADEKHRLFQEKSSDFIGYLTLWSWYQFQAKQLSQSQLRRLCKKYYLNFVRMREWYDLYRQLLVLVRALKFRVNPFPTAHDTSDNGVVKNGSSGSKSARSKSVRDKLVRDKLVGNKLAENRLAMANNRPNEFKGFTFPHFSDELIHQALLVGLLDQVGMKDEDHYFRGANNQKFRIFPGSILFKKPPPWLMAMEIVETTQVYARTIAKIKPEWLETLASHLVRKSYSEPHWSKRLGQAAAYETLLLFNLPIISQRLKAYGKIAPEISRELLIREGLVEGEITLRAPFYRHNQRLIESVEIMEDKTRRRDILIEEWQLYNWYDERLPEDCYSVADLESWCKMAQNNRSLQLKKEDLFARDETLNLEDFPEKIELNQLTLDALYLFDPTNKADGMTLLVPLAAVNLLDKTRLDWLVPGLIKEKVLAILRTLPKALRKMIVPLPDRVELLMPELTFSEGNLYYQLAELLTASSSQRIEPHHFDETALPAHLRMNIRIIDRGGKTLAEGRDLKALQRQFKTKATSAFAELAQLGQKRKEETPGKSQKNIQKNIQNKTQKRTSSVKTREKMPAYKEESLSLETWQLGRRQTFTRNGIQLTGYSALILTEEGHLKGKLFDRPDQAYRAHLNTLIALTLKALKSPLHYLRRQWPDFGRLALLFRPVGSEEALRQDLMRAIIQDAFLKEALPYEAQTFKKIIASLEKTIIQEATELSKLIVNIFQAYNELRTTLNSLHPANKALIEPEVKKVVARLIYPNLISKTPFYWRGQLPRYLKALEIRVERFPQNSQRDKEQAIILQNHWENYQQAYKFYEARGERVADLETYRWHLEELAISFFAQPMKTVVTISDKRLKNLWDKIALEMKNRGQGI